MTSGQGGGYGQPPEGPGGVPGREPQSGWSPPPGGPPPYGAGGGYAPAPPAPWGWGAPTPVARPSTVRMGIGALAASLLLSLVSSALSFSDVDAQVAESVAAAGGDAALTADAARALIVVAAVIGLLLVGLNALFLWFAWRGHNWARIVLWVLGGLSVVFGIVGLAAPTAAPASLTLLALLQLVLTAAGIVLLALKPSNEWYRYRGWQRATAHGAG